MSFEHELQALRSTVALSMNEHRLCARLSDVTRLQRLCSSELRLQDGRMEQRLFLREDGTPFADVSVARDGADALLIIEGPSRVELRQILGEDALEDVTLVSLDGPRAVELLASICEPGIRALPFQTFCRVGTWRCFRSRERGYDLWVSTPEVAALRQRALDEGGPLGVVEVGLEALDEHSLDHGAFNVRREGRAGCTAAELQLQWRVSPAKTRAPLRRRMTKLASDAAMLLGSAVRCEGMIVGHVVNAGQSCASGRYVALAVLDVSYAWTGLDFLVADTPARSVSL